MHQHISDHERQVIATAAAWLSRVLDDPQHVASNKTRLERMYQGGQLELGAFMAIVRQAYSMTIHRLAELDKPAAYLFRIVESLLNEPVQGDECPY